MYEVIWIRIPDFFLGLHKLYSHCTNKFPGLYIQHIGLNYSLSGRSIEMSLNTKLFHKFNFQEKNLVNSRGKHLIKFTMNQKCG